MKEIQSVFQEQEQQEIKAAFALYYRALSAALPEDHTLQEISFSKKFEQKMERLLEKKKPPIHRLFSKYAAVVLICLLSVAILFTAQKIHFLSKESYHEEKEGLGSSSQETAAIPLKEFSYTPENFHAIEQTATPDKEEILYSNLYGETFTFGQYKATACPQEDHSAQQEIILPGSYHAFLIQSNGHSSLHIDAESLHFIISSPDLPKEELIKIGESIAFDP